MCARARCCWMQGAMKDAHDGLTQWSPDALLARATFSLHDGLVTYLPLACFLLHKCVCFDSILISSHISLSGPTSDTCVEFKIRSMQGDVGTD